jgi:hypothetical protein
MTTLSPPVRNIFSATASLIPRALLREPERKWRLGDFVKEGMTMGFASKVLSKAEAMGYVHRVYAGPKSHTTLVDAQAMVRDWARVYQFDRNFPQRRFLFRGNKFVDRLSVFLRKKGVRFALTLFSASRRIASFVGDSGEYVYLDTAREEFPGVVDDLQMNLGLVEAERGGNVLLAVPYYREVVFPMGSAGRGTPVVDALQLYLDLMGYPPAGSQEAENLRSYFQRSGGPAWARHR